MYNLDKLIINAQKIIIEKKGGDCERKGME